MTEDRMLVALDGSRPAQSAAMVGLWLARALNLSVQALYIVEVAEVEDPYTKRGPEVAAGWSARSPEEAVALDEEYGQRVLDEFVLAAEALELKVKTEVDFGGVIPVLEQAAQGCHLVTLGKNGQDHLDDKGALGANCRDLLSLLKQPLLIGGGQFAQSLDRILLAYNGGDAAAEAIRWVMDLKEALDGLEVEILSVDERTSDRGEAEAWLQEALAAFPSQGRPPQAFIHRGDAGHEILAAADEHSSDLIVMGRPAHMLSGTLGKTLLHVLQGRHTVLMP